MKKKKKLSKKTIIAIVMFLTTILISGLIILLCQKNQRTKLIEKQINNDIEALKSHDITEINKVLFLKSNILNEYTEFIEPKTNESDSGIMTDLLALAEIKLLSIDDATVNLSITAPNMSQFGDEVLSDINTETNEKELKQLILNYAKNTEKQTSDVTLEYTEINGIINVKYNDSGFLNAITGNISTGYSKIYEQYLIQLTTEASNNV